MEFRIAVSLEALSLSVLLQDHGGTECCQLVELGTLRKDEPFLGLSLYT